jgi:hypothetical protein
LKLMQGTSLLRSVTVAEVAIKVWFGDLKRSLGRANGLDGGISLHLGNETTPPP